MNPSFIAVGAEGDLARQALAHNGLASHAQEWNREWQRAQACAWLHATPEPGSFRTHAVVSPAAAPDAPCPDSVVPGSCAIVRPSATRVMQQSSAYGRTAVASVSSLPSPVQNGCVAPDEPPGVETRPPGTASGGRLATRQAPAEQETASRTTPAVHGSRPEKDPLRLHVECAGDGLHVWIGADGDTVAVSARAAAILAELRRTEHGFRAPLALVVCNGRTMYASVMRTPSFLETSP